MYQVYALQYAERTTTACQFFYREPAHEPLTLHYYVWLILGGPRPVLVDAGVPEAEAARRGLDAYVSPVARLARLGVPPEAVELVVLSHLHWDHCAGHSLFPAAELWLQEEELAFWTGRVARYPAYQQLASPEALAALVTLGYAGRVRLVRGQHEVRPGLRVHWVGGHTAGLQIVTVETARGRVVLTSDAAHFYRNLERRQPVQIVTSLPEMFAGFETIEALAGAGGLVVAGHDPEVARRFTPVEPGVVRIA